MAVDLARTFLEIVRCGSFVGAAEHLHLTQAAITARVQSLESQLNCSLFVRNRSGARLTPDGVARLVVSKNLGGDSLQRWLIDQGYPTERVASTKGFRILEVSPAPSAA